MLVVFAKQPRPGFVKTRMTPALCGQDAADLYRAMLLDVLAESERTCARLEIEGVLTVTPADACADLAALAPKRFRSVAQRGASLGERMEYEVARAFASGAGRVVLRGSDNPALGSRELEVLWGLLDTADVAISPDLDGGYGAIGLRRMPAGIFQHAMSTETVLDETTARAQAAGLSVVFSPGSFDLDTVEDFRHLARIRQTLPAHQCPRTLAYLDQRELW